MATKTKSRSGKEVKGLHRVRVSSDSGTKEYRTIERHSTTIIDNLGSTVSDPARFARVLKDESLVTNDIVDAASVPGTTLTQRIAPIMKAVLAQIELKASLFHKFMDVLWRENPCLKDKLQHYYLLELNAVEVVGGVSDWEELGRQLGISSRKITQLVKDGGGIEHCREEVVLEWLKGDNTASWEKLCEALERMGRKDEVLIINEQYLQAQVPMEGTSDHNSSSHAPPPVHSSSSPLDGPHLQPALNPPQLEESSPPSAASALHPLLEECFASAGVVGHPMLDMQLSDEIHIADIAKKLTRWKDLFPYFKLRECNMEDIEAIHGLGEQKKMLLKRWSQEYRPIATYRQLCIILCQQKRMDLVMAVCEVVKSTASTD